VSALIPGLAGAAVGRNGRLQALLDEYVATGRIAGVVAAVGTRAHTRYISSGRIALSANAPLASPDSLWRIYSMTKLVTGAAAMALVEDGRLDLDVPVSRFISSFSRSRVLMHPASPKTRPARSPVTVRHLMTHTSGLVGSLVPEPPLSTFYVDRKLNVSRVSLEADAQARHQRTLQSFASAAGTVPLAFDPGTRWSYGISSDVLGAVIEKAAGMPFEAFLDERIFEPLGMHDTTFVVRQADLGRFATNYAVSPSGLEPVDAPPRTIFSQAPPFPFPSSGLVSSTRDFARFAAMLLGEGAWDGRRVLAYGTARLMMSNLLPQGVTAMDEGWGAGGLVRLGTREHAAAIGRVRGTYGWEGAAGTVCWVDRANGIYVVLMSQFMPSGAHDLHAEFSAAALSESTGLSVPENPAASGP
jgi:CubicO group peptidase (beta-lactamase class C family)